MNRNPENINRRRDDLNAEIESRKSERVSDVIRDFAGRHYLSESTVWKDYKHDNSENNNNAGRNDVNSKRY